MKAILKFNLDDPEDRINFYKASTADNVYYALGEILNKLRNDIKYSNDEIREEIAEKIRDMIIEELKDRDINTDYL